MSEIVYIKKVQDKYNQRFYELSKPVFKAPNERYILEKELEYNLKRIKEEYKKFLPNEIKYVCVSDAHTHTERLLFLAMPLNEEKTEFGNLCGLELDGEHTMMIHGGNSDYVYEDDYYLERLAKVNNLTIVKENKKCK